MIPPPLDLLIIGGGAAGFFAAIRFAELRRERGERPRVLILEQSSQALGKVLISGGGRCNLTHACFDPAELVKYYPRGSAELRSAFARFQPADTIEWFQQRGVALKTEADGRVFPISDSAQEVVDCLLEAAARLGVALRMKTGVAAIQHTPGSPAPFTMRLHPQREHPGKPAPLHARQVLLASGGSSAGMNLAAGLGHAIQPPVPSLFTFKISDPRLAGLAGVSIPSASLQFLQDDKPPPGQAGQLQAGALLITHWGLSGPVALRLSAWAARWLHAQQYRAELRVNWLHPMLQEQAAASMRTVRSNRQQARRAVSREDIFDRLPQRLWRRLVQVSGIPPELRWADLSKSQLNSLAQELTGGRYNLHGKAVNKEEFVTCGGVTLNEVDFASMQSRLIPGLYFAGEVLDIDGLTGGFNFQNAWTTAWIAASAAAQAHLAL
jgi:predicted Rossmann fold flavoprotein